MIKNITNQSYRNKFTIAKENLLYSQYPSDFINSPNVHSFSMKRPVRISANGITYKGTEENGKIIIDNIKVKPGTECAVFDKIRAHTPSIAAGSNQTCMPFRRGKRYKYKKNIVTIFGPGCIFVQYHVNGRLPYIQNNCLTKIMVSNNKSVTLRQTLSAVTWT